MNALAVPFFPFTKFSKQYENSFKKSNNEISQQVGSFISNLLKLNARQLMNKKIKRKKNPAAASHQDPIHAQDPFQESFTASEIITQKNMSHLLTNYLSPTIEAIKRVPSKYLFYYLFNKINNRVLLPTLLNIFLKKYLTKAIF